MRFARIAAIFLVLAAGVAAVSWFLLKRAARKPNIVLVVSDTTRADHLGCYGYPFGTSPSIDAFARTGVLFERCYSHAPVTGSSHASILTGFYPHETGVYENQPLSSEALSLPEILKRHGYATMAVISNYVLSKGAGYEQGITIFDDTMEQRERVRNVPERRAPPTALRAAQLIHQVEDEPFFLWVLFQDPHGPYTAPGSIADHFRKKRESRAAAESSAPGSPLRANPTVSGDGGIPSYQKYDDNTDYDVYVSRYDAEVNLVDQGFRTIIDALERRGILDRTIVVFTADHGEGMGEHEYYFAHGEYLYEGLIHVPLVMRYGKSLQGRRTDVVRHIDIVPTLLKMAGVEGPSSLRGRDIRKEDDADREVLAEMDSPLPGNGFRVSLTRGGLKLVHTKWDEGFRLYDLRSDPREEIDLYEDPAYLREAEDLRAAMNRLLAEDRLRLPRPAAARVPSPEEAERLRSLGYVR